MSRRSYVAGQRKAPKTAEKIRNRESGAGNQKGADPRNEILQIDGTLHHRAQHIGD
jgi:hypothetical protein